ncbi:hypothetical protein IFM89_003994 [Coptis chinensis]|uniref:Pentatricopeptide repeat-containing protein n=1 Tax=Coptis chinensis TaxID=261450 RepID=A0A835GTY8_9MAGN|nr:hypothetical protein IFM89_003994 [Coptis chinensis]
MFVKARGEVFEPNVSTLVLVLQACRNLRAIYEGLGIHRLMDDISVQNSLLGFHSLVNNEWYWEALSLFPSMVEAGFEADAVTISQKIKLGFELNPVLGSALVDLCSKHGCFSEAFEIFKATDCGDVISWTTKIRSCATARERGLALRLYYRMIKENYNPAIATVGRPNVERGEVEYAKIIFEEELCGRSQVSWNSLLTGYAQNGCDLEAVFLFQRMLHLGGMRSSRAYVCVGMDMEIEKMLMLDLESDVGLELLGSECTKRGRDAYEFSSQQWFREWLFHFAAAEYVVILITMEAQIVVRQLILIHSIAIFIYRSGIYLHTRQPGVYSSWLMAFIAKYEMEELRLA